MASHFGRSTVVSALVVAALAPPVPAVAGPVDVYNLDARSAAMAGAQTARADSPTTLFRNPSALVQTEGGVTAGFLGAVNRGEILLARRPEGFDIPDLGARTPTVPSGQVPRSRRDTTNPPGLAGLMFGVTTSFGIDDFRAGFAIFVPTAGIFDVQTHFADERERLFSNQLNYDIVGGSTHRLDMSFGAAYRVTDWMSVGLGATFLPGARPQSEAFLPDVTDQSDLDLNADIKSTNAWGVLGGLLIEPGSNVDLALSFRDAVSFDIKGRNRVRFGTGGATAGSATQEIDWTISYSPAMVFAGSAVDIGDLTLQLDAKYARWSDYRDDHSNDAGFHDTVSPKLGAEYALGDATDVRAGLSFVPTPVPEQTGRTNYVDNHRIVTGLGAGHAFDVGEQSFEVEWGVQLHLLVPRTHRKRVPSDPPDCGPGVSRLCDEVPDDTTDPETGRRYAAAQGLQTGNPGFPAYSSGGWLGAVNVEVTWLPDRE
ncbi:MAG: OmpP1/FadL family transporter [Bradymonadaceae bacterium]